MKTLTLALAAALAAPVATATPTFAATLTPETCQPISGENRDDCCAAENWRELLLPGDIRFCPPLNKDDKNSGRMGEDVVNTDTNTDTDPEITGSIGGGNPGNLNAVGGAGEKPGNMDDASPEGSKGNSN